VVVALHAKITTSNLIYTYSRIFAQAHLPPKTPGDAHPGDAISQEMRSPLFISACAAISFSAPTLVSADGIRRNVTVYVNEPAERLISPVGSDALVAPSSPVFVCSAEGRDIFLKE